MTQPGRKGDQTGDLVWGSQPRKKLCFYCNRPNPTGTASFGSYSATTSPTQISVCADGTGCQDDRIYHGPPGLPHHAGEPCEICDRKGPGSGPRGNSGRRGISGSNQSNRHR